MITKTVAVNFAAPASSPVYLALQPVASSAIASADSGALFSMLNLMSQCTNW